jgi:diguanylate cyclase (GGDEF)-like protein
MEKAAQSGNLPATVAIAAGALLGIAAVDLATGTELSLSLFYLGPISLLAWRRGLAAGFVAAVIAAATWLGVDAAGGNVYSHGLIPVWNSLVRLGFFVIVCVLLVRLRDGMELEAARARSDPLTGLLNRRAFEEEAGREIGRSGRTGLPVAFAYLDLDRFKEVNDRLGHAAGDQLLRTVATIMGVVLRAVDLKARLGGDEFALVLPDTGAEGTALAVERLAAGLSAADIECSIGAVVFESPPGDVAAALAAVDAVMYEAKRDPARHIAIRTTGSHTIVA